MRVSLAMTTLLAGVFLSMPFITSAQVNLFEEQNLVSISQNPKAPAPNSMVTFTVSSAAIDLSRATITWYVNGTKTESSIGGRTMTTVTSGPQEPLAIQVAVTGHDGTAASTRITTYPGVVHLLWEANTYTPAFYRGRALPSPGSSVRIHADALLHSASGTRLPEESLEYIWTINGRAAQNLSGIGKSNVVLTTPSATGNLSVSVLVRNANNTVSGSASTLISTTPPILALYAFDPVGGIVSRHALGSTDSVPADWGTLVLEPYYSAVSSPKSTLLSYQWNINGTPIAADGASPNRITLSPEGIGSALAQISVNLRNALSPLTAASGAWNITVTESAKSSPFGTSQ